MSGRRVEEEKGGAIPTAYTRSSMDTGILGSNHRVQLDAITAEAESALVAAAEKLQSLVHDLRVAYRETVADANSGGSGEVLQPDAHLLASARALLGRLELADRHLRDVSKTITSTTATNELDASRTFRHGTRDAPSAILQAQEAERARLAEELHDGPAQALANMIFQVEIVRHAIRSEPEAAEAEVSSPRNLLERELDKLRTYIHELRAPLTDGEALEDALRESVAELSGRTGIGVDVHLDAPGAALDETQRAVALRVAQEALRNVGKHASATRAWLSTRYADAAENGGRCWILEVGDNGHGFNLADVTATSNRRHFGLRFMRERAQLLDAELSIDASPAAGTVVRLTISTGGERS